MEVQYYITYETNPGVDGPVKRPTVPGDWRVKSIAPVPTLYRYGSPQLAVVWENDQTR